MKKIKFSEPVKTGTKVAVGAMGIITSGLVIDEGVKSKNTAKTVIGGAGVVASTAFATYEGIKLGKSLKKPKAPVETETQDVELTK